jgi:L-alanine-DL-glutamate epimerase-like enolase superfamily enzyme
MKITHTEVFVVDVPYIEPVRKVNWANPPYLIYRMHTDEGLAGIGEQWGGNKEQMAQAAQQFAGKDPLTLNLQSSGFQSALYDIVGQALKLPVHKLIGDKCRDRVPVAYWSCHMPPEETAKEAEKAKNLGFKVHKLKARPQDIVQQAELITKAAGDDYQIRPDPNFTFETPETALRLAKELEKYNIECFEDPIDWRKYFDWYPQARKQTKIKMAHHLGNPADVFRSFKEEAVDCVNIGGGVLGVLKCAAVAEAANSQIWHQMAGLSLGIQATFAVHVACTIKNATMPCDELPFIHENDLIGGGLVVKEGHFLVPEGTGLGIQLDEKALKHYRVG